MIADDRRPYCDLRSAIIWKPALTVTLEKQSKYLTHSTVCAHEYLKFGIGNILFPIGSLNAFNGLRLPLPSVLPLHYEEFARNYVSINKFYFSLAIKNLHNNTNKKINTRALH